MAIQKNAIITSNKYIQRAGTSSTYTIAGTLTNSNGVFSGFSASNYITTNGAISAASDKFVVYGHYRTADTIGTDEYVGCTLSRNLGLRLITDKFSLGISSNSGSSWTSWVSGSSNIRANTDYFYKIVSDNTKIYVYINGILAITTTLPTGGTYSNTTWGYGNHLPTKAATTASQGSIDINACGIEIAGITTWSGSDAYTVTANSQIGKNYVSTQNFYEI